MSKWLVEAISDTGGEAGQWEVEASTAVEAAQLSIGAELTAEPNGSRLRARCWELGIPGSRPEITYLYELT